MGIQHLFDCNRCAEPMDGEVLRFSGDYILFFRYFFNVVMYKLLLGYIILFCLNKLYIVLIISISIYVHIFTCLIYKHVCLYIKFIHILILCTHIYKFYRIFMSFVPLVFKYILLNHSIYKA